MRTVASDHLFHVRHVAAQYGADPAGWRGEADRTSFVPGLIPETIRRTNRPTYQQVLELVNR